MALVAVPYSFTPNTVIASAQVNANFAALVNAFNGGIGGSFTDAGYVILPGGVYIQWATVGSVPGDGSSEVAVDYPVLFPNGQWTIALGISNAYQTHPFAYSAQYHSPSLTGFYLDCAGGPPGSTVSITYVAIGN